MVPTEMLVTSPVSVSIVPALGLLLLHVPPDGVHVNVVVEPAQTLPGEIFCACEDEMNNNIEQMESLIKRPQLIALPLIADFL